jgi:hypothetical protein
MRIKIISGPAAGQIRHAEKSQATQLLIDTGLAELVIEPPPAPPTVSWYVGVGQVTQRFFIAGRCSSPMCSTFRYEGPASAASQQKFLHSCGAWSPVNLPTDVANRYAAAKSEELPVFGKDEGVYWKIFHNKAGDNTHRPVDHGVDPTDSKGARAAVEGLGIIARLLK